MLEAHLAGRANHAWLLLLLLTFGTWHRRYLAGRPVEERLVAGSPMLDLMR